MTRLKFLTSRSAYGAEAGSLDGYISQGSRISWEKSIVRAMLRSEPRVSMHLVGSANTVTEPYCGNIYMPSLKKTTTTFYRYRSQIFQEEGWLLNPCIPAEGPISWDDHKNDFLPYTIRGQFLLLFPKISIWWQNEFETQCCNIESFKIKLWVESLARSSPEREKEKM